MVYSISCTTRSPREGETDGVDYYFITPEEFAKRQREGNFLEWAVVHGHYYGTPESEVIKNLQEGKDVILELDVQGAINVKRPFLRLY